MYKDNLFKLIRGEEVILWTGAGLSIYAGYPSGTELSKIIFESLTETEKSKISANLPLVDLAEEFYRLKGNNKNSLLKILEATFISKAPKSLQVHESLVGIPHFKTIITTNYDRLFEIAYKDKVQLIIEPENIPYIKKEKVQLFKVHGDLTKPSSIILTKSDYNNFFKDNKEDDIYWNVIKERLSTKSVLFMGYSLEDPNVTVIFDRIFDVLNEHRKECFLVAPNLPEHKITYLNKKGVHYINDTSENLINELLKDIKENIRKDLGKGIVSSDTFRAFFHHNNLIAGIKSTPKAFDLHSVTGSGIEKDMDGLLNLSFKKDFEFIEKFKAFTNGEMFGDFAISKENLIDFNLSAKGINILDSDGLANITISNLPKLSTKVDLTFADGSEFSNIPIKIYASVKKIEIHADFLAGNLISSIDNTKETGNLNFSYKPNEICQKVNDGIELFSFLEKICSGLNFTAFGESGYKLSKNLPKMDQLLPRILVFLDYFKMLKEIEQLSGLRFVKIPIDLLTNDDRTTALKAITAIKNGEIIDEWEEGLIFEIGQFKPNFFKEFKSSNSEFLPMEAVTTEKEVVEIHGHKINLGYRKVKYLNAHISNLDGILTGEQKTAIIKSKSNQVAISYLKDLPPSK